MLPIFEHTIRDISASSAEFGPVLELLMARKRDVFHGFDNIILDVQNVEKPDGSYSLRVMSAPYFIVDETKASKDIEGFLKEGLDVREILDGRLKE